MKRYLIFFNVFLWIFGFGGSALALPVTFDFTGGSDTYAHNATFTGSDGLTTVYADELPTNRDLFLGSTGLGVYGPDDADAGPGQQVDGLGTNEGIIFTFSTVIQLTSVSFASVGADDDFAFYVGDGAGGFNLVDDNIDIPGSNTYYFSQTWISDEFKIAALNENDDFFIAGMEAQTQTPTPEPATLLLMGAGLLGLAGAGRKRFLKK